MISFYYDKHLTEKAKILRKTGTVGEKMLWSKLKKQQIGYKFTRQKPMGKYIVDFFNFSHLLAIEIDGASHNFKGDYDNKRQVELEKLGIQLLRFTEKEVITNTKGVVEAIKQWFESTH